MIYPTEFQLILYALTFSFEYTLQEQPVNTINLSWKHINRIHSYNPDFQTILSK